jgi:hypothetical protein
MLRVVKPFSIVLHRGQIAVVGEDKNPRQGQLIPALKESQKSNSEIQGQISFTNQCWINFIYLSARQ